MRALLLVCLIVVTGCSGKDGNGSPVVPPADPEVKVDAVRLFYDYNDNAVAADQKYKGKALRVTGTVREVASDWIGFVVGEVSMEISPAQYRALSEKRKRWFNDGVDSSVICQIDPAHKDGFAKAVKGKPFSVVGRCVGVKTDPEAWEGKVVHLEASRPD
jgi:hypothetical protein